MSIPQLGLQDLSRALEWVFLTFLPNFCLGQGLEDYYSNYEFKDLYLDYCIKKGFGSKITCEFAPNPCCAGNFTFLSVIILLYEPRHEKTCLRGFRPGKTQTSLLSHRDLSLEILDLASIGIILSK